EHPPSHAAITQTAQSLARTRAARISGGALQSWAGIAGVSHSSLAKQRYDSATARHYAGREPTPNVPVDARALPVDAYAEGERFAGGEIPLGKLGGAEQIGLNITIVPPRRQSAPFHYHLFEEEHFYVLRGRAVLRTSAGR